MAETYTGEVRNGVVVFDSGVPLPSDGTRVRVQAIDALPQPKTLAERLEGIIGKASGLPADLAEQHDHYLHGQPKR